MPFSGLLLYAPGRSFRGTGTPLGVPTHSSGLGGFTLHDVAAEVFLGVYDGSSILDLSPLTSPTQVYRFCNSDNNTFRDAWDPVHSRVCFVVTMFNEPLDQML